MHSDVLNLLDAHLAELQALRRDLTPSRSIRPGARWDVAAATLESTRHFASELSRVLTQDHGVAAPFGGGPATNAK
jgi:hypothetical protein